MKRLLILLFAALPLLGYAQKFELTDDNGNPYTDGDTISAIITEADLDMFDEYIVNLTIQNLTVTGLDMNTLRTNITLINGMRAYVCMGVCYEDDEFVINRQIPGRSELYSLHLEPKGKIGLNKFKLEFWTEANQSDKITLYVEIEVKSLGIKAPVQTSVSLSAFPNPAPAHSKINIAYTLADKNDNQLVIRNIMGAVVMNIPLNPDENNTTIDASNLKSGVYFYTIENKNRISIAKKLIVK